MARYCVKMAVVDSGSTAFLANPQQGSIQPTPNWTVTFAIYGPGNMFLNEVAYLVNAANQAAAIAAAQTLANAELPAGNVAIVARAGNYAYQPTTFAGYQFGQVVVTAVDAASAVVAALASRAAAVPTGKTLSAISVSATEN